MSPLLLFIPLLLRDVATADGLAATVSGFVGAEWLLEDCPHTQGRKGFIPSQRPATQHRNQDTASYLSGSWSYKTL